MLSLFFSLTVSDKSMTTDDDLVDLFDFERFSFFSDGLPESGELLELLILLSCNYYTIKT